jgi:hypothetical protein
VGAANKAGLSLWAEIENELIARNLFDISLELREG